MSRPSRHLSRISQSLTELRRGIDELAARHEAIEAFAARLLETLRGGHKVLTAGNGGSAAQALHLAEELMGRFLHSRRPLAALCLCADATALTCIANDFGYEEVFARQIDGLAQTGDTLVVLTTSGRSANILRGLQRARDLGVHRLGLLGAPDSPAEKLCDATLTFDGLPAARIQEIHQVVIHLLLEIVETEIL